MPWGLEENQGIRGAESTHSDMVTSALKIASQPKKQLVKSTSVVTVRSLGLDYPEATRATNNKSM
jgi:hypothetical protein